MRYNSSEYKSDMGGFSAPLPAGRYKFRVTEAKDTRSKNTNAEMISLKLVCTDPEHTGKWVFDTLVATNPYVSQRIGSIFASGGIDPRTVPADLNAACFNGLTVEAQIKQETYEGKTRSAVHYYVAAPSVRPYSHVDVSGDGNDDIPF